MRKIILLFISLLLSGCETWKQIDQNLKEAAEQQAPKSPSYKITCQKTTVVIKKQMYDVKMCMQNKAFSHDIYRLFINDKEILKDIDDHVMKFSAHYNSEKITGGCKPNVITQKMGNTNMPIEASRTCDIYINNDLVASFLFKFS